MWTGALVFCHVFVAANCVMIEDNRGPWPTQAICSTRLDQMTIGLSEYFSKYSFVVRARACKMTKDKPT